MDLHMPLAEAMRTQRSIRRLKPDPVDDALIMKLLELALKAPSGGNRQNAEFVVVRDPAVKRGLGRLNRVAWGMYGRIWKFFARNDAKTLRAMKAVDGKPITTQISPSSSWRASDGRRTAPS